MIKDFGLGIIMFILFTVGLNLAIGAEKDKDPKIIGGTVANITNLNYLVYLSRNGAFACGGALISPLYVLTAAHCVQGYTASTLTLTGGTLFLNSGGVTRRVSNVYIPAAFSRITQNSDIAVLRLNSALTGTNIGTIPICSQRLRVGALVRVSGWGIVRESATRPSRRLRTTTLRLRSRAVCLRAYQGYIYTRTMICASAPNTDTCSGDSGGPLVYNGEICGIVSWGNGCARRGYPGVYTNINRVKNFIRQAINN